jgi:hypothetical protein
MVRNSKQVVGDSDRFETEAFYNHRREDSEKLTTPDTDKVRSTTPAARMQIGAASSFKIRRYYTDTSVPWFWRRGARRIITAQMGVSSGDS